MTYIVRLNNGGYQWYLRATIWTAEFERSSKFATRDAAASALQVAAKFMPRKIARLAVIEPWELSTIGGRETWVQK